VTRNATPPTPPGPPAPAAPPALAAGDAATLLDRMVYEQVVACIDLDELHALEQAITLLATELDDVGPDRATDLARAMVDAALRRLPDDLRRYLDAGGPPFDGCPLCEEEARASRSAPGSSQRRGARGKA
jgi:hypothetical protein